MVTWPAFIKHRKRSIFLVVVLSVVLTTCFWMGDRSGWAMENEITGKIKLTVGKSTIVKSMKPVKRVSLAAPEIADFILLSPTQIYLTGKSPGVTNLLLWENAKVTAIYDLHVTVDVSRLKEKLHEVLPEEEDLKITPANDAITLSGTVSSTANLSRALAVTKAYVADDKVINLVEVAGVHQVMLEVRVAEMSRSLGKSLGFNFNYAKDGKDFAINKLSNLTQIVQSENANLGNAGAPFSVFVSPTINALFRIWDGDTAWTGFIDALKEEGLIKILAEPTLIALSGQSADFLAGGEFPVPVPQGLGSVAIQYKSFGVGVAFTPVVLSDKKISIKVAPEVSELDLSTAVILEGFVVPGLTTRRASTVVELADGQSFAIAGLLKENVRDIISKFPVLGDIPVLGALFRSSEFQKNETELIIIATPHLVKPLNLEKQPLPTDAFIEPTDSEFFLLGILEGREPRGSGSTSRSDKTGVTRLGKFEGDFGQIVP